MTEKSGIHVWSPNVSSTAAEARITCYKIRQLHLRQKRFLKVQQFKNRVETRYITVIQQCLSIYVHRWKRAVCTESTSESIKSASAVWVTPV